MATTTFQHGTLVGAHNSLRDGRSAVLCGTHLVRRGRFTRFQSSFSQISRRAVLLLHDLGESTEGATALSVLVRARPELQGSQKKVSPIRRFSLFVAVGYSKDIVDMGSDGPGDNSLMHQPLRMHDWERHVIGEV
jgi:hypothetical protein